MGLTVEAGDPSGLRADVLVVPVAEGTDTVAEGLDERLRTRCGELLAAGEASGEFAKTTLVHLDGDSPVKRVALAGLGRRVDADAIRTAVATAAREASRI